MRMRDGAVDDFAERMKEELGGGVWADEVESDGRGKEGPGVEEDVEME